VSPQRVAQWRADLELARAAALLAGEIALRTFGSRHDVEWKAVDQPLTQTDLAIDRLLREMLTAARPEYGWLSEETVDEPDRLQRERVWIVDPIDGTRSFIAGRPEFTVSIGLAEAGRASVGVIYNPVRREMFTAIRGHGAHLERDESHSPLSVRTAPGRRRQALASSGDVAAGRLAPLGDDWRVKPVGSTAYKMALVASGAADVFVTPSGRSEWDVCAGDVIVAEAGGSATDLAGQPLQFNRPRPELAGIIAAAAGVAEDIQNRFAGWQRDGAMAARGGR
jgi:myo-inositol-1(or 4)-monophosphatase